MPLSDEFIVKIDPVRSAAAKKAWITRRRNSGGAMPKRKLKAQFKGGGPKFKTDMKLERVAQSVQGKDGHASPAKMRRYPDSDLNRASAYLSRYKEYADLENSEDRKWGGVDATKIRDEVIRRNKAKAKKKK